MSPHEARSDDAPRGGVGDELIDLLDALDALDAAEARVGGHRGRVDRAGDREPTASTGQAVGAGSATAAADAAVTEDRSITRARARLAHQDAVALAEELADTRRRLAETRRRARRALDDGRRRQPAGAEPGGGVESSRLVPQGASAAQAIASQEGAASLFDASDRIRGMGAQLAAALDHAARRLMPTRRGRSRSAATADVVDQTLTLIVAGAIDSVPHTVHAGISMIDRSGVIRSRAPSDPVAAELDALQNTLGEGPCRDAVYDPHPVLADDLLAAGSRWPRFAAAAHARGVTAVLSFQLFTADDGTTGALNLYAGSAGTFDRSSVDIGSLFASQAALALHGARRASDLDAALGTRDVIGQAKGILMERFGVDSARAFALLVETSQSTNVKVYDVAEWTVRETVGKGGAR